MGRWCLLLPIGFITTDRSLLSGGDMIVVCNWVLECCVRYEIQRAATPPGVPCGPGSSLRVCACCILFLFNICKCILAAMYIVGGKVRIIINLCGTAQK